MMVKVVPLTQGLHRVATGTWALQPNCQMELGVRTPGFFAEASLWELYYCEIITRGGDFCWPQLSTCGGQLPSPSKLATGSSKAEQSDGESGRRAKIERS